jgi:hypothetical protein
MIPLRQAALALFLVITVIGIGLVQNGARHDYVSEATRLGMYCLAAGGVGWGILAISYLYDGLQAWIRPSSRRTVDGMK